MELGEILRACGIALIALSLCAVLKAKSVALAPYLTQTAALSIVITSLSALIPLFAFIKDYVPRYTYPFYRKDLRRWAKRYL